MLPFRCTSLPRAAAERGEASWPREQRRDESSQALTARERNANEGAAQVLLLFPAFPVELQAGKHVFIQDK